MEHEIKFDEDISMYKQAELLNGGKVDEDHMGRYIAGMIALMDGFICEATEGLGFDEFRRANIFEAAGRAISDLGLARLFANNWDENNRPGGEEIMRAGKVREIGNAILGMEE